MLGTDAATAKSLNALYDQWDRNATDRQHILTQLAVRRLPSSLEFPPMRTVPELQKTLGAGEAAHGPVTAAIANAVFDALEIRVRHLPITRDSLIAAMELT